MQKHTQAVLLWLDGRLWFSILGLLRCHKGCAGQLFNFLDIKRDLLRVHTWCDFVRVSQVSVTPISLSLWSMYWRYHHQLHPQLCLWVFPLHPQVLFYEDDVNNLQFYDYVLTFGGEVCTYKCHFHISTHSLRVHFQIKYMWKPRKHITPAAILFVVTRYAAFPMVVLGAFPVSVFSPFPQGDLSCSSLCSPLLWPRMCWRVWFKWREHPQWLTIS
jgi:hypothetical protein